MATTAQNNIVASQRVIPFNILTDGTADINAGDQVYLDTSAHVAKSLGSSDDTKRRAFPRRGGGFFVYQSLWNQRVFGASPGRFVRDRDVQHDIR